MRTLLLSALLAIPALAAPVLLISIDGLRPDYVTKANEHGLKIPNLRKFVSDGTYAQGVTGVLPTITYPSHTTIVTGVWPAEHGILGNVVFDPLMENFGGWYWYANDIRVPTLWDAADKAHIVTASLNWPATVGAKGVRYLVPEYWRTHTPDDRKLLEGLTRPGGWLEELEAKLGPYTNGNETTVPGDELRTKYTLEILATKKPGLMTLHLTSLDEMQHESSPFSKQSNETLEALDGMIGRLVAGMRRNDPNAVVAIVSDHGFVRTDYRLNIGIPFIEEGFVKLGKPSASGIPTVASWDAEPWAAGSAAIMLHHPEDAAMKARVKAMLDKLAANPDNGIARVIGQDEARKMGGFPDAAFVVEPKPGYQLGGALSGPLVTPLPSTGTHGYFPDRPEMRASLFLFGRPVAAGLDLGIVDMRQIAPTVAAILGVSLPSAKEPALKVTRK